MKERTWVFRDKRTFGPGPWVDEPDKTQWQDAATGLRSMALRNPRLGTWCGYVGVERGHAFYGMKDVAVIDALQVHGGITFACRRRPGEPNVNPLLEPGEPDDIWWFGFACAHGCDLMPAFQTDHPDASRVYRTLQYVEDECAKLAAQLADTKSQSEPNELLVKNETDYLSLKDDHDG